VQWTITFPSVAYAVAAGHRVDLKVIPPAATAARDLWVAYDTTTYPTKLQLP
jgi:hypothetical protein